MFYLRRDKNSIGLSDYDRYLRDGGSKLINSLDDVGMSIVAEISGVVTDVPVSWRSSMTSLRLINFNMPFRFIANRHGTKRSRITIGR